MRTDSQPVSLGTGSPAARITLTQLAAVVGVAAVLHVAQEVFLPLAIAMLITFALSPPLGALRRFGVPQTVAVLTVVGVAFAMMVTFALVVASQLASLAENLPVFQANILAKLEDLKAAGGQGGAGARLIDMISTIDSRIGAVLPGGGPAPMPVEVVEVSSALDMVQNLLFPLIGPLATAGLIMVVVVFMLIERADLRDRFLLLVGTHDLHRTTGVLEDAGARVANYLLIQLLINLVYALPIGIGLFLIGVPNAPLWGLLTLILRFVPYIGTFLAAAFPLLLAFAVSPGWSAVLWTAALFAAVEAVTSNLIEPWLYGSRTGLSPLAILVAAVFWAFLWGPLGLVLSTPLTVCLVVLGRHMPQFAIFDILFGDTPVLAPHARLYQRLLAGDATEAGQDAEEALEETDLVEYYQTTLIPALLLAQEDRDRGVMGSEQQTRLAAVAMTVVRDMGRGIEIQPAAPLAGTGLGFGIVGARSALDDVAAEILAQALQIEGAQAQALSHGELGAKPDAGVARDGLILTFLNPNPTRGALLHVRRLKRALPGLRVGVVILQMPAALGQAGDDLRQIAPVSPAKLAEAEAIGADFAVTSLEAALRAACDPTPARPLPDPAQPTPRARTRARLTPVS